MDDFLLARDAYVNGEYAVAIPVLRSLAERPNPDARVAALVTPARKYYAASLFAQGQEAEARAVLARMLREDPDARLDQVQFEAAFLHLFDAVLNDLQPELEQIRSQRVLARQRAETALVVRREMAMRLLTTEQRVSSVPRWLTALPFGAGQFLNGQRSLGWFFLITEATLAAVSVTTWAVHTAIYPNDPLLGPGNVIRNSERDRLADAMYTVNIASAIGLGAFMLVGMVHALVTWQPDRQIGTVPRPLPRELQGVQISVGGGGAALRIAF